MTDRPNDDVLLKGHAVDETPWDEQEMVARVPNPGSDAALALGCACPVLDNAHGQGYLGVAGVFVFSEGCPVHDETFFEAVRDLQEVTR